MFLYIYLYCLRANPENANEAIMVWGDTGGCVNAINFTSVNIALFERPPAPAGEKQGIYFKTSSSHVPFVNVKMYYGISRDLEIIPVIIGT